MLANADRIAVLPDHDAADAFHFLADKLTEVFHVNLLALMADDSPEPVHRARVALRRFRAVLKAFAPILDDDLTDAMQVRARALFRLLGNIRDADVMAMRFAGTDRAEALTDEAAFQRRKTRKHLKRKKADRFRSWVLRRLATKGWRQAGKKAKALREAPVRVLAATGIGRAWADCTSNGPDLRVMSTRAQHDLRKDLKVLRYLTEFFADLWPGVAQDRFLSALRSLQDDLGEMTDTALAISLGHEVQPSTTPLQERPAKIWAALLDQGPWWSNPEARG